MILSFSDEFTENLFHGIHSHATHKGIPAQVRKTAERRLDILNCAESLESLACIPGIKAEGPVRDSHGKYSIPVYGNMSILFCWDHDSPSDVEIKP